MQNLFWKLLLIVLILALCAWGLSAKEIRLGKDLRGGVSLIYRVAVPDEPGIDRAAVINQTIEVLKDRVNPTGVLDITIQPLGLDRIEVVMPLPSAEVRELRTSYHDALEQLLRESQIVVAELDFALQDGSAETRFCGGNTTGSRCIEVRALQDAYDTLKAAREASQAAVDSGATPETLAQLETAEVQADIDFGDQREKVLAMSLDRSRIVRAIGLSTTQKAKRDATDTVIRDPDTDEPVMEDSPRQIALDALKRDYASVAAAIDSVVAAHDEYQERRTGLDDPEDLIRLMRGAGVLEYHISVDTNDPQGVDVQDMRSQLQEMGPANTDRAVAGWYPINDLKQWYDSPEQRAALEANPRGFFQSRRFAVEVYDGEYFMLLYNLPSKQMVHKHGEADWTVTRTFPSPDQLGRPAVSFQLDPTGGTLMAKLTGAHVGKPMAIVLDGEVFSAPTLISQISGSGIITGTFSQAEISYLIRVLAAGSMKARLSPDPIATNTLGPSLGADNLRRGQTAFTIAIIAVAVFMLFYYFVPGLVADIALLANGLIIFGVMAMIDGTFTLPGLAGIVLTIGMAVDANVLIYERIREEIFNGEDDIRVAIRMGYGKALSTIIDANITNLIVCLVLFKTATSEVKGFALTLTIGICATLFTALFVTRQIYTLYTEVFKGKTLTMLPTVFPAIHRALEPSINWIGMRKIFWTISSVAIVLSLTMVFARGVDMFDTEFRGGVTATLVTAAVDADGDGLADRDDAGEIIRRPLAQNDVEARIQAIAEGVDPASASDPAEAQRLSILAEMENAKVLTTGTTETDEQGRITATSFQIKVANPRGIDEETSIKPVVVDAIVAAFSEDGEIDVSPSRQFDGEGNQVARNFVYPIDNKNLGAVIGSADLAARDEGEYLGGVLITVDNIDPPITMVEIADRIEQMRNQPDYQATAGRSTKVIGRTPVDPGRPDGEYTSVVILSLEPNLSSLRVDADVWYSQLAEPEWFLVQEALQKQSSLQQVSSFSSAVAATLAANAVVAVTLSILLIVLYIWVRFGSLRYSLAAIAALVHDVTIALGLLALTGWIGASVFGRVLLIEEFRIDLGVVAAMLTIIGYSLNDTIVILDRIRENRGKRRLPTAAIVNRSINQTVSRTLLTSTTTLVAVLIMFTQGGSGIRPFTFCLLVGLVVGTYSSVAIAAPLVYAGGDGETDEAETEATETTELPAAVEPAPTA